MIKNFCDRCEKEIEFSDIKVLSIGFKGMFFNATSRDCEICDDCTIELVDWMKNGKEKGIWDSVKEKMTKKKNEEDEVFEQIKAGNGISRTTPKPGEYPGTTTEG